MFLEHWNKQKILSSIQQHFSCLLDEWIAKIWRKKNHVVFFLKSTLSVLRCTWTIPINLKILLGFNNNCLSIWQASAEKLGALNLLLSYFFFYAQHKRRFQTQLFKTLVLTQPDFENPKNIHFKPEKGHFWFTFKGLVSTGCFTLKCFF